MPVLVGHRAAPPGRLRSVLVLAAVLTAMVAAGLAVTVGRERRPGPTFVTLPDVPPVPMLPSGAPSSSGSRTSTPVATTPVRDGDRAPEGGGPVATRPRPSTSSAKPTPAPPILVPGTAVGFEPVGQAGRRVRHRNFLARIDAIGPGSSALDKADSRFLVRAGRADAACTSLEASNYPGYFLREARSGVRLDRADGSTRYDAEATFCAVPLTAGGFVLRSKANPDRYITQSDAVLSLQRVAPDRAQAFVTRSPF